MSILPWGIALSPAATHRSGLFDTHHGGPHDQAPTRSVAPENPLTDGLALATRGLQKRYGSRTALAGLDLSVPTGVVYGFLGPNGAGKTTTMRLLTGLIHPDAGTIEVLGQPFGRRDRRHLFDVGALIESPSFYPYLSARENLRSLAAAGGKTPAGRIEELLEMVGLRDRAKDKVQTYSLGMKQRLGIAAALLSNPRLLLLDEPSNGLDPAGIVAMRETLKRLAATGKTVFVSSHILGEVEQLADVLGIIAAGRLVREGPIGQILAGEGLVRVRVAPTEIDGARRILDGLAGDATTKPADDGWLAVPIAPDRAAEVNRALATAGIYASGIETGNDLEALFLTLTAGDDSANHEGTFFGAAGSTPAPPSRPGGDA
jgi:ABC-2 type transport system ATP-binding protein